MKFTEGSLKDNSQNMLDVKRTENYNSHIMSYSFIFSHDVSIQTSVTPYIIVNIFATKEDGTLVVNIFSSKI